MEVPVEATPAEEKQVNENSNWPWPELPMPRDSHLLPLQSQQILRIARSPWLGPKPSAPLEEDRGDMEEEEETKEVKHGFTVKKYAKVPHHLEESQPEYLAKRRRGLPSQYTGPNSAPLRETKVKKVDSEGNVSVFKALVPEGQTVEGEIQPSDPALAEAAPASAAPGTIVEGVGVVNAEGVVVVNELAHQTPPRRRHPIPAKKKGRRGRVKGYNDKKVVFAEGATEQGTPVSGSDQLTVPNVRQDMGSMEPSDGDTPMADIGDDEEGEEGSEEEGEDRVQSPIPDSRVKETVPASVPETTRKQPSPPAGASTETSNAISTDLPAMRSPSRPETPPTADVKTEASESLGRQPSSSPDLPLSTVTHSRQNSVSQIPTISSAQPGSGAPDAPPGLVTAAPVDEPDTGLGGTEPPTSGTVAAPSSAAMPTTSIPILETSLAEVTAVDPAEPASNVDSLESKTSEVLETDSSRPPPSDANDALETAQSQTDLPTMSETASEKLQHESTANSLTMQQEETNHPSPDLLGSLEAHLDQSSNQS